MPLDQLTERISQFEMAAVEFDTMRRRNRDLVEGDRKRVLLQLDSVAKDLCQRMIELTNVDIRSALARGETPVHLAASIREGMVPIFQAEFGTFEALVRHQFDGALGVHQTHADELIGRVRKLAAELLAIPYTAPDPADHFELRALPYWVTETQESFTLVPTGMFDALLPAGLRRRRRSSRLSSQMAEIIERNVENLRWSLRRSLEDGFRLFEMRLDQELRLTLEATREALQRGMARHSDTADSIRAEMEALSTTIACLDLFTKALQEWAE
jgi:hypothetical protein